MKIFIELTQQNGDPILVNVDHITNIDASAGAIKVFTSELKAGTSVYINVSESYAEIMEMLSQTPNTFVRRIKK